MQRKLFSISGRVQGVGFRPFVFRLAARFGLSGHVRNAPEGVLLEAQGNAASLDSFARALRDDLPPLARMTACVEQPLPPLEDEKGFHILQSEAGLAHDVLISPDVATCPDCLADLRDPLNRRHSYPFTNCTNCGPRYTITAAMPYDRAQTSMACFPLCPECGLEYGNPLDRRFHAQPNACPICGPQVWLVDAKTLPPASANYTPDQATLPQNCPRGDEAMRDLARRVMSGQIAAVKGLGGFHLVCDAARDEAVARLRAAKSRPHKPLAIMLKDMESAGRFLRLGPAERALLESVERPIVLCPCMAESAVVESGGVGPGKADPAEAERSHAGPGSNSVKPSGLSRLLSPDTSYVGAMLPYTPLHHILLEYCNTLARQAGRQAAALVMTSGNRGGEPIALGNREALTRLRALADCFLLHNRDILIRTDDSVLRPIPAAYGKEDEARTMFLRRARGFVPVPIALPVRQAGFVKPLYPAEPAEAVAPAGYVEAVEQTEPAEAVKPTGFVQPAEAAAPAAPLEPVGQPDPAGYMEQDERPGNGATPHCVLGLGAELKNTICISRGNEAFVSQHIGDMQNLETNIFQREIAAHLASVLQVKPDLLVCDAHPDFAAHSAAAAYDAPHELMQHHFAHAAAVLAENGHSGPALVLALDGTGFAPAAINPDHGIWGGELILAHPAAGRMERVGSLAQIPLPGGEAAIRNPWRIAHALLLQLGLWPEDGLAASQHSRMGASAGGTKNGGLAAQNFHAHNSPDCTKEGWTPPWLPEEEKAAALIAPMLARRLNTPFTSSAGRLFDAVSALLGVCQRTSYEGQAAIRLEEAQHQTQATLGDYAALYAPWRTGKKAALPCPVLDKGENTAPRFMLNTHTLFEALFALMLQGASTPALASAFHYALAEGLAELALAASRVTDAREVGLSGGVMQNISMHVLLAEKLRQRGLTVLTHRHLPPGDGCIAYGQVAWHTLRF